MSIIITDCINHEHRNQAELHEIFNFLNKQVELRK